MKKYFVLFSAAVLALAGCAKEMAPAEQAGDTAVTFSVETSVATKATIDNDGAGANVDECRVAIFMKTGEEEYTLFDTVDAEVAAGKATFTANLIKAQTYKAVAWCDKVGMYEFNEDLTEIKRADLYADACNNDGLDAFFGATEEDFKVPVSETVKIIAKRPFAQLNLIATDVIEKFQPTDVTVKYTAPTVFNAVTGEASEPVEITYTADAPYYAAVAEKSTITMNYIFASEEGDVLNEVAMTAKVKIEDVEASFANVPAKRNFRTNIIGPLFTDPTDFEVDVDPSWEDPDTDIEIWDGKATTLPEEDENTYHITTAGELKAFADAVNEGISTFEGKTVILDNDIDLSNVAWKPIGGLVSYPSITFSGVFDGQGFTVKNLKAEDKTVNYACAGLFGSLVGSVKNLNIDGFSVSSSHYAGAICGYSSSYNTEITNCTVKNGTIVSAPEKIGDEFDNGDKVGGIIGIMSEAGKVDGCTVENVTITAYRDLGGVAGAANGTVANNTVKNVTVNQDDTNAYKTGITTFGAVIGRNLGASLSNNTTENVVVTSPSIAATIGDDVYPSVADAIAAATADQTVEIVRAGTYKLPATLNNITIKGSEGVVFDCVGSGSIASIPNGCTFDGCTFEMGQSGYHGFQHAGTINMKNCTINGLFFSYGDMNFDGCTFNQTTADYNMWDYGQDLSFKNCVFNSNGKFLHVYNEGNGNWKLTVDGCTFNSETKNKAAINIKASCGAKNLGWDVVINNCKVNDVNKFPEASGDATSALFVGSPIWQVDDRTESSLAANIVKVTVDGAVVYGNK